MVIWREEEMNQTTGELTKGTREYACQTTDDNDNNNHDDDADDDDDDDNAADDDDDDDDDRHNRHHDDDETTGGRQRICVPDNYQKSVFKLSIMIHKLLFPIHSFPNYFFSPSPPSLHSSPLSPHSSPPLLNISGTTCRT